MAVGDSIRVTEGSGKYIAAGATYTENALTVRDEKAIIGEPYLAEYIATPPAVLTTTAASHLCQIMAGSALNVYIRSIEIYQLAAATAAAIDEIDIFRLTTAGTGGGVVVPVPLDTTDAAAGFTCMTLPTVKGTEAAAPIYRVSAQFTQTIAAQSGGKQGPLLAVIDFDTLRGKALRIPAGTANGIAIKNITARAAATVLIVVRASELPW